MLMQLTCIPFHEGIPFHEQIEQLIHNRRNDYNCNKYNWPCGYKRPKPHFNEMCIWLDAQENDDARDYQCSTTRHYQCKEDRAIKIWNFICHDVGFFIYFTCLGLHA